MANPYYTTNNYNNICSSSPPPPPPPEPDDISIFLQQFLLRSSSSSSSFSHQSLANHALTENQKPAIFHCPGRIYSPDPYSGWVPANFPSSPFITLDNDPYDYDCDSEEGFEAVPKPMQGRNSAKRCRVAEVHNLSEKRRRSRINEKMKALQKLIPNSNKSDKSSMLDEAIEYLKQLQLQVQMLTMRNGLSRYPLSLPGILHPVQDSQLMIEHTKSLNPGISTDQGTPPVNPPLNLLHNNYPTSFDDLSRMVGPKASFQIESSIPDHFGPLQFSGSSTGICREEVIPRQQLNQECSHSTLTGTKSNDNTLEACYLGGGHVVLNSLNTRNFSSHLNLLCNGEKPAANDNIKSETREM